MYTPFWLLFAWNIFLYPFISTYRCLWILSKSLVHSCIALLFSANVCVLIGEFNLFTFKVITNKEKLTSVIRYLFSLCLLLFFCLIFSALLSKRIENRDMKRYLHIHVHSHFNHKSKKRKAPKCSSMGECTVKTWHLSIYLYLYKIPLLYMFSFRKEGILTSATTWMKIEYIVLSEISQAQKWQTPRDSTPMRYLH